MDYNNTSTDLWYQYFNATGPQWLILFVVYGIRAIWATIGILFNFGIVYVTVKTSSLCSICNILIAMESAFALILNMGYFVSFFVVASGIKFIRYEHCFWALILPTLAGDMAQSVMVFTGLDRVFAVSFPFWYKQRNAKKYLSLAITIICSYGIYVFLMLYIDYGKTSDIMLSCSPSEMGQSFLASMMKVNGLILSAIIIIVYTICWFLVFKFSSTAQNVTENNRKLTKSLLFIIGLNLIGVFTKITIGLIMQTLVVVNVFIQTPYTIAFSFVTITVYSANAPVLYIISSEYRARFDQHFPKVAKMFGKMLRSSSVAPNLSTPPKPWIVVNNGIGPSAEVNH